MRFVNKIYMKTELPYNWQDLIEDANKYVDQEVEKVREDAKAKNLSEEEIEKLIRKVRAKAINAKSNVWAEAKKAFQNIIGCKCWYCEMEATRFDQPVDHFRPKNSVAECDGKHDGYWWLAFDWKNYRLACTFCNSLRRSEDTVGGKQDRFPLIDPSKRAWGPEDDLREEKPMLLDPCVADDPKLLAFEDSGRVHDNPRKSSEERKRAIISIEVYHLDHPKLVRERKKLKQDIARKMYDIKHLDSSSMPEIVDNRKNEILQLLDIKHPLSAAARFYFRGHRDIEWVNEQCEEWLP